MTKMNQHNTTEEQCRASSEHETEDKRNFLLLLKQRTTVESTAEIPGEELPHAILSEIDRLQSEHFNNTTVTGHSLLFNHTKCDSVYLNEMLADFGPEFPTLDLDSGLTDKTLSDTRNLPETNPTRVAANFVEEICEEIIPISNNYAIQGNSIALGAEFVVMLNQLQQQQDIILKNNSDLKSRVMQQQQMILDLQKYNLELDGQVVQQHDTILEMRKKLNALTETHRFSYQTSASERLKPQEMTQIDQEPAVELNDRPQIEIAEVETVTTNELSLITDQLQVIECARSATGVEAETQSDSEEVGKSEHAAPSPQEDNFNQSHSSSGMKQVRLAWIRKGDGKRINLNLESIEESPANARTSRQQPKSYTCGECKKQFNRKDNLVVHCRIHSGEKPYECEVCNAAFSRSGNLRAHQKIHSGEKSYECEKCDAAFSHASTLKTHQRTHSGEKPYECEVCNSAFTTSSHLKTHQRTHSGEKPYDCEVCNSAFTTSSALRRHQRTHSGEKSYECEVCNAAFIQSGDLRRHQKIHSGGKSYECEVCNAAFSRSSNLRVHQRTHTDEKPFICDICKKSFGQKITLSKHMDIHSNKKSHKCNECHKEFRDRSNFKRHLQTHSERRCVNVFKQIIASQK